MDLQTEAKPWARRCCGTD